MGLGRFPGYPFSIRSLCGRFLGYLFSVRSLCGRFLGYSFSIRSLFGRFLGCLQLVWCRQKLSTSPARAVS